MTLMKALSLKLIKGTINEAEQTCTVTWVLPRVLNKDDIRIIDTQLDVWLRIKQLNYNYYTCVCDEFFDC